MVLFFITKKHIPHFAYDIEPECENKCNGVTNVIKSDYLETNIKYLWGKLIIGNPPYGRCLSLAQKFYKKSVDLCDYIAFILPISQFNNSNFLYEFDLIYSEDLGTRHFSDRDLHCCFNIYARPLNGELNSKPQTKLNDITIYRQDSKKYNNSEYDLRMCYWGDGTAGKILKENEHYSAEYKIKIQNVQLKNKIINVLSTFDWKNYIKGIAMRKIQQHHIIEVLKNEIPEIK